MRNHQGLGLIYCSVFGNQHCLILTGWILSTITFPWLCSNHNPTCSSRSWIHPFSILWLSRWSLKMFSSPRDLSCFFPFGLDFPRKPQIVIEKSGSFLEVVDVYVSGIWPRQWTWWKGGEYLQQMQYKYRKSPLCPIRRRVKELLLCT